MAAVGRHLAASSGPTAEDALLSLCHISWNALELLQQLERHLGKGGGTGSMQWAGLLAWPAAALSAAPLLLPLAGPDTHGELLEAACGLISVYMAASSKLGADAMAETKTHLPAALRVVLHAAGWLAGEWLWHALHVHSGCQLPQPWVQAHAPPLFFAGRVELTSTSWLVCNENPPACVSPPACAGHASFRPDDWRYFISLLSLQTLFSTQAYAAAAAAALAAVAPDNKPGRQLASCLLDSVCCLAEMGPPASWAATADSGAAAHECNIVQCWKHSWFCGTAPPHTTCSAAAYRWRCRPCLPSLTCNKGGRREQRAPAVPTCTTL